MQHKGAYLVQHIPYMFLLMDSEAMFEKAMTHVIGDSQNIYTASDFMKMKINKA